MLNVKISAARQGGGGGRRRRAADLGAPLDDHTCVGMATAAIGGTRPITTKTNAGQADRFGPPHTRRPTVL